MWAIASGSAAKHKGVGAVQAEGIQVFPFLYHVPCSLPRSCKDIFSRCRKKHVKDDDDEDGPKIFRVQEGNLLVLLLSG